MALIVNGLPENITEVDIFKLFQPFGSVINCNIRGNSSEVILSENAEVAQHELNGTLYFGVQISVEFAVVNYSLNNENALQTGDQIQNPEIKINTINTEINPTIDYQQKQQSSSIQIKDNKLDSSYCKFSFFEEIDLLQQIKLIFFTSSLTEMEIINQLKQFFIHLQNIDFEKFREFFKNQEIISLINNKLNNCTTELERELLNIIELVVQRDVDLPAVESNQLSYGYGKLAIQMNIVGLIVKIENILSQKIKLDVKNYDKIQLETTQQLIRIYFFIYPEQKMKKKLFKPCLRIISMDIKKLIEKLSNKKNTNINGKDDKYDINEELEKELLTQAKMLIGFEYTTCNQHYLSLAYVKDVYKQIAQLIHLNCPLNINCPHNICTRITPGLENLQISVFNALSLFVWCDTENQNYMNNEHNIIMHISPFIISLSQLSYHPTISSGMDNQLQFHIPSQSVVSSTISLLSVLCNRNKQCTKSVTDIHDLFIALIKLLKYKSEIHSNKQDDLNPSIIRNSCFQCLQNIHLNGDKSTYQEQFVQYGLISGLIFQIGSGGSLGEQDDIKVNQILNFINEFITELRNRTNNFLLSLLFIPKIDLTKSADEQLEEFDAEEEIQAHLFNSGNYGVKYNADELKDALSNHFIDK